MDVIDKNGKPLNRPFAVEKRQTKEEMLRVRVIEKDSKYTVEKDGNRIIVKEK